jgi:putative Holliday junction resolvase
MRYLCLDYGQKRMGLAVCDREERLVSPLAVLEGRAEAQLDKIAKKAAEQEVDGLVVGLPLNMDGSESKLSREARDFGERVAAVTGLEVVYHDERLSSFGAEKKLAGGALTRKKKKNRLDAVAAAEILQDFLDKKGQ